MENKINIAELLKDCPKGMELDCKICNGVKFIELDRNPNFPIVVRANNGYEFTLTKYGQVHNIDDAKCVIFPKGKTTWEGFQRPFRDGDVIYVCDEYSGATFTYVVILKQIKGGQIYSYCFYSYKDAVFGTYDFLYNNYNVRLATEEEKIKLFQTIKDNGYKWNAETKTLEKLVDPRFKIGNRIKSKINQYEYTIVDIAKDGYIVHYGTDKFKYVPFYDENNFDLVPNKFDVINFEPFMKVLVKSDNSDVWECDFFSSYNPNCSNRFHCIGAWYDICIPYIGNEHLRGTTNDCDEYYKIWE